MSLTVKSIPAEALANSEQKLHVDLQLPGSAASGGPDPESGRETPIWCSSKGLGPSHVQLGVITIVPREFGVTFWLL